MKKLIIISAVLISYLGYRFYESYAIDGDVDEQYATIDNKIINNLKKHINFYGCVINGEVELEVLNDDTIENIVSKSSFLKDNYSVLKYNLIKNNIPLNNDSIEIECKKSTRVYGCVEENIIYFEEGDRLIDFEKNIILKDNYSRDSYESVKFEILKDTKIYQIECQLEVKIIGCMDFSVYIEDGELLKSKIDETLFDFNCDLSKLDVLTEGYVKKNHVIEIKNKKNVTISDTRDNEVNILYSDGDTAIDYYSIVNENYLCNISFLEYNEYVSENFFLNNEEIYLPCVVNIELRGNLKFDKNSNLLRVDESSTILDIYNKITMFYERGTDFSELNLSDIVYEGMVIEIKND